MAPYSFMTARADDANRSNLRRLTWNCRFFLIFYDASIAKKSKVNGEFSRISFGENVFFNFAHFEILMLPFTYYFLEKFCQSNSVK